MLTPNDRFQLENLWWQAFRFFETEPARGKALLNEGRNLARHHKEACYELVYNLWDCVLMLFYTNELAAGLDLAVRSAVEASKPANSQCKERVNIYCVLVDAYLFYDPIGYADKITENITFVENELQPEYDNWCLGQWRRTYLALTLDDLDGALNDGLRYVERSAKSDFRLSDAYAMLCETCYWRGEYAEALDYAKIGELHAQRSANNKRSLTEFAAWRALFARINGNEEEAQRAFRLSEMYKSRMMAIPSTSYYDAICEFHQHGGDLETAFQLREQELNEAIASGSPHAAAQTRLKRCRLLKKMGKPYADELKAAREIATKLIKPELFLAKLDVL